MIVILAVIAILAAIAIPVALRIFQVTAEEGTREELQNLKEAMIGNPRKLQSTVRSDFGFLGDIGRLPSNTEGLDAILLRESLPTFTFPVFSFDSTKQAGAGWKGPYITGSFAGEELEDFKNDQLGTPYAYDDTDFTNANGELADAKITSGGPDGTIGTADDIVVEILKSETFATIRGRVKTSAGDPFASTPVDLHFPSIGSPATVTATTDSNGDYSFTSVPFGKRSVQARPRLGLVPNTATDKSGELKFTIVNFSSSPVTLTSLVATYTFPGESYDKVFVDGVEVVSTQRFSGDTATFSPSATIAASPVTGPPPLRVFVDAPDAQLPDLIVFPQGGTEARIELKFSEPMAGIPITITFSDGSVVRVTAVQIQ